MRANRISSSALFRFRVLLILSLQLLISCASVAADDWQAPPVKRDPLGSPSGIKIGIIGDQTGTTDLDQAYTTLAQGVAKINAEDVDVVLHVGDLLESSKSENEISADFGRASGILDTLNAGWYLTPGDHDVNPPMFVQNSTDRSREQLFQTLYGAHQPQVLTHPYYSFDVDDYHFVALYSHEALHADPRWGNIFLAQISDTQFQWLSDDLESHKNAEAIILFIHQPLWYNRSAWRKVHNLLKKYNVAAVISGHFHYDQDLGYVDGIRYITVGATGGSVKQGNRDVGNAQHVSVLHLTRKGRVDLSMLALDDEPLNITPAVDMDKMQSVDVMLGELWNFSTTNPIFFNGSTLVSDCNTAQAAQLHITPIGNPTDKALNTRVTFSSDDANINLDSPGYVASQCADAVSEFECNQAASSRIWSSNFSSVSVNQFAGPLWQSGLTLATGHVPAAGTALHLNLRLSYAGVSGALILERDLSTSIQHCP